MKAEKFSKGLFQFAGALPPETGAAVGKFAELLNDFGAMTIAALLNKSAGLVRQSNGISSSLPVNVIIESISDLERTLRAVASKTVADDAERLLELMKPHQFEDFSSFLGRLRDHLQRKPAAKQKPSGSKKSVDAVLVKSYLSELEDANSSSPKFQEIMSRLEKDKRVRLKQELTEIANKFYSVNFNYPSKKKALETIRRRHAQDNRVRTEDRAFSSN